MVFFEFLQMVLQFRNIEERWPNFKEEPSNIRLPLAVDGVNPFAEVNSIYSV
jgi:hypothetical protein